MTNINPLETATTPQGNQDIGADPAPQGNLVRLFEGSTTAQRYNIIGDTFSGFNGHTMPMSMRKLFQAQLSAATVTPEHPLGDDRSRHIKALMAGTVGAVFTAATRIVRIAVWTLFLLPAVAVRFATANRYGMDGVVPELFKKYKEEFVDAGVTLLSIPVGLAKTIRPGVFSEKMGNIALYYLNRADRREAFATREAEAKRVYEGRVEEARALRRDRPAPVHA